MSPPSSCDFLSIASDPKRTSYHKMITKVQLSKFEDNNLDETERRRGGPTSKLKR